MESDINKMLDEIQSEINKLEGQKTALIYDYVCGREARFFAEVLDLLSFVNVTPGDYYAPTRKRIKSIKGVKNIRIGTIADAEELECEGEQVPIMLKVTDKAGEHAAKFWRAQGVIQIGKYLVKFGIMYSKHYYE